MGNRPRSGLFLCSVNALTLEGPFPPIWASDVDATNVDAGIHCAELDPGLGHAAERAAKWITKAARL